MKKPITIPRDLKPGDRLWYSKTQYANVAKGSLTDLVYQSANVFHVEGVMAVAGTREMRYRLHDGIEVAHDTPPIIRIERIASAKPNRRLAAAKEHLRRKMEVGEKAGKQWAVVVWCVSRRHARETRDNIDNGLRKMEIRAIARRLENKK